MIYNLNVSILKKEANKVSLRLRQYFINSPMVFKIYTQRYKQHHKSYKWQYNKQAFLLNLVPLIT